MAEPGSRSAVIPVRSTRTASPAPGPQGSPGVERTAASPAMTGSSWTHATQFEPVRASASAARAFVRLHLRDHGLDALVDDVGLVVSELATNAVKHAGTPFTVRLRGDGHCLLLTVHDRSRDVAFERPPGSTSTGGRGLAIVDRLSHDWGVDHADEVEKSVWASFRTP